MRSREEELTDGDWRKCIDRVQTRGSEDLEAMEMHLGCMRFCA
jgi:hypothetical protein